MAEQAERTPVPGECEEYILLLEKCLSLFNAMPCWPPGNPDAADCSYDLAAQIGRTLKGR